jgi:signal transduction histidine kinase
MPTSGRKNGPAEKRPIANLSEERTPARQEIERLRRELKLAQERGRTVEAELGQILHDGVCQELSAVALYLQILRNQLEGQHYERVPEAMEQLAASVRKAVGSAHSLSQRLRKP